MPLITVLEWIAIVLAIGYLVFAAYESIWCWPLAIISTILYTYICFQSQLYLETFLQFFYLVMAIYGWLYWKKNKKNESVPIISVSKQKQLVLILIGEFFSIGLGYYFSHYTHTAFPWLDAHITVFSIVTTWMVTKKIIQNWLWWIVIDSAAAYLYFAKDLKITATLYVIYVVMVIVGYYKWKKIIK